MLGKSALSSQISLKIAIKAIKATIFKTNHGHFFSQPT